MSSEANDVLGNSLVVRIKRKRNQEPPSSICIVEDDAPRPKKHGTKKLSANTAATNASSKVTDLKTLMLHRVHTIDSTWNQQMDEETIHSMQSAKKIETDDIGNQHVHSNTQWITCGKKKVLSESKDQVLVVDMEQVPNSVEEELLGAASSSTITRKKATKIVDPITRKLEAAILTAYNSGDFSDVLAAVKQGANVNYQRTSSDGMSALMVAAGQCNARVVSKLLASGASVSLGDCDGRTAKDYLSNSNAPANSYNKMGSAMEVSLLLQNASTVTATSVSVPVPHDTLSDIAEPDKADLDYVYDIFCIPQQTLEDVVALGSGGDGGADASVGGVPSDSGLPEEFGPRIRIPGLHIDSQGLVEMVFEYDSDWSDLGDDEDPDSNDERYFGNDYPEEEELNSDGEGLYRNAGSDDDIDFNSYEDDVSHEQLGGMSKFQRNSVGKVLHPFVFGHNEQNKELGTQVGGVGDAVYKDTESIQQLWGQTAKANGQSDAMELDDAAAQHHQDRLVGMQERSGLQFGSSVNEFDSRSGLAKYGADLSDDDENMTVQYLYDDQDYIVSDSSGTPVLSAAQRDTKMGMGMFQPSKPNSSKLYQSRGHQLENKRPPLDTVAYDDELDQDSD